MLFLFQYSCSKAAEQTLQVEGRLHGEVTYFFSSDNMAVQRFLIYTGKDSCLLLNKVVVAGIVHSSAPFLLNT